MPDPTKVAAYSTETGAKHLIPAHWLDHPELGKGFRKTPSQRATDETPSESWTIAALTDHAEQRGIELGGATRKADILAAIFNPFHQTPSVGDNPKENPDADPR